MIAFSSERYLLEVYQFVGCQKGLLMNLFFSEMGEYNVYIFIALGFSH